MKGIMEALEHLARRGRPRIAIGVGSQGAGSDEKVLKAAAAANFADMTVLGKNLPEEESLTLIESDNIEKDLIRMLKTGEVHAVVRGSARASQALKAVKKHLKPDWIGRIALLETHSGWQFFLAPVGVDEGNTPPEKIKFIEKGAALIETLGITPKVGVLSGGRSGDYGRHGEVDKTIDEARAITEVIKSKGSVNISNYNILIEEAIKDKCNFIIAPKGITGNLIFRTLTYLGGGKAHGAPMVGIKEVYVDTSRAASEEEYLSAIMMAAALVNKGG